MHKFFLWTISLLLVYTAGYSQQIIFLDAGHGGSDPGAISDVGITEAEINLQMVTAVKKACEAKGIQVFLTRQNGENLSLNQRIHLIDNQIIPEGMSDRVWVLSIHTNVSQNRERKGMNLYTLPGKDLQKKVTIFQNQFTGMIYEEKNLIILKNKYPSLLLDVGYISNPDELNQLTDIRYQNELAEKIANAVLQL